MPREAKKNCCALDVLLPVMVRWSQKDCSAALGFWNCQNGVCEPTAMNKEQFTGEKKKKIEEMNDQQTKLLKLLSKLTLAIGHEEDVKARTYFHCTTQ